MPAHPPASNPFRLLLAGALLLGLSGCGHLFLVPMQRLVLSPDELGLDFENVFIDSSDGVRLYGWFLPAEGPARGTILFLHGNAENISTHIGSVYWLPERGYNVLLVDYRGYGASTGTATLHGAIDDSRAALRWLLARPDIDHERIVVLGQSLGGALGAYAIGASELKSRIRVLILDSSFGSYRHIAREKLAMFWLTWPLQYPLSWTLPEELSPENVIADISPTPILFIHGVNDAIIPLHHAQRLYDAAQTPKSLWIIPDSGHIAALQHPEVRDRLITYLDELMGPPPER